MQAAYRSQKTASTITTYVELVEIAISPVNTAVVYSGRDPGIEYHRGH
jgi:hypothetical protein